MKKVFLILSAALFAVSCSNESYEQNPVQLPDVTVNFADSDVQPGKIIVKFTPDVAEKMVVTREPGERSAVTGYTAIDRAIAEIGGVAMEPVFTIGGQFEQRQREAGLHHWYLIDFDSSIPATKAVPHLYGVEGIEVSEPSFLIKWPETPIAYEENTPQTFATTMPTTPNDPFRMLQDWHYNMIDLYDAWKVEAGSPEVIVAVLDGGVDGAHQDLAPNMWRDANGNFGYNFPANSYNIPPDNHGTHVAGTVAAVNNNGKNVCGIAGGNAAQGPGASIMSCYIEDIYDAADAFAWAADNGAVIAQCSWGIGRAQLLTNAINYFVNNAGIDNNGRQIGPMRGGLVVFAAGNDGVYYEDYPAGLPNVMSVAALDPGKRRSSYSTYHTTVDICAPGGDSIDPVPFNKIMSTMPNNQQGLSEGTSMAAPHVSGVAALVIADDGGPGFTLAMLKNALLNTTTTVVDPYMGAGCVNALGAVNYY